MLRQAVGCDVMTDEQSVSERAYWAGMHWCLAEEGENQAAEQATLAVGSTAADLVLSRHGGSLLASHWPCVQRTKNSDARQQMVAAGESLAERFQRREKFFCLDDDAKTIRIESVLATPLVFYAANETLEQEFGRRATQHARTVRDQLVRSDGAVVGEMAWGEEISDQDALDLLDVATSMRGFEQCFDFTNQTEFLIVAEMNADYWLSQEARSSELEWVVQAWGTAGLLAVARSTKDAERTVACRDAAWRAIERLVAGFVLEQWQQQPMAHRFPTVLALTTALREINDS